MAPLLKQNRDSSLVNSLWSRPENDRMTVSELPAWAVLPNYPSKNYLLDQQRFYPVSHMDLELDRTRGIVSQSQL